MAQEFDSVSKVHIHRDSDGIARDLMHIEEPFVSTARTPQLAAGEYLEKFSTMLGVTAPELRHLGLPPETKPIDAGVEYRFLEEKTQFDMTTVVYSQTCLGLQVQGAGLTVNILWNPLRVVGAQSTSHVTVTVTAPTERAVERLQRLDAKSLVKHLGLSPAHNAFGSSSIHILKLRLIIYRYESGKRIHLPDEPPHEHEKERESEQLEVPLPPVPKEIEEHRHYVAAEVIFELGTRRIPNLRWVAIIEAETLSVLYLRPFVDTVDGLVFKDDPMTANGGPLPSASSAGLNPLRTGVPLLGLSPPVAGTYALNGDLIQLLDVEPPAVAPPTEPVGTDFDFDARTDNFAAVNAYYHCDRFFRLVQSLGFDLKNYFGGTLFPTAVDHRGLGGNVVNATV